MKKVLLTFDVFSLYKLKLNKILIAWLQNHFVKIQERMPFPFAFLALEAERKGEREERQ